MTEPPAALSTLHGISIGSLITGAGVWTAVATLIGIVLRSRVPMRKMKIDADERLREDLLARVEKLESKLEETRAFYEAKMDQLQAEYEAGARVARHELANAKMRFRALVMLLKRLPNPPEGLTAILVDIEAMEAEQSRAEAAEKGAQSGARVAAATAVPVAAPVT